MQMDKKEELEQELQWVQYRQKMLDIIDKKLMEMKEIAEQVKEEKLDSEEVKLANTKINNLLMQVKSLDEESRKYDNYVIGK